MNAATKAGVIVAEKSSNIRATGKHNSPPMTICSPTTIRTPVPNAPLRTAKVAKDSAATPATMASRNGQSTEPPAIRAVITVVTPAKPMTMPNPLMPPRRSPSTNGAQAATTSGMALAAIAARPAGTWVMATKNSPKYRVFWHRPTKAIRRQASGAVGQGWPRVRATKQAPTPATRNRTVENSKGSAWSSAILAKENAEDQINAKLTPISTVTRPNRVTSGAGRAGVSSRWVMAARWGKGLACPDTLAHFGDQPAVSFRKVCHEHPFDPPS